MSDDDKYSMEMSDDDNYSMDMSDDDNYSMDMSDDETSEGYCVGELSSFESRCSALMTEEDCVSEGVSAFSDGVCDWIATVEEVEPTTNPSASPTPVVTSEGYCVGELSSFESRCSVLMTEEDCVSEGVSAFSDGVCDWIANEDESSTAEYEMC